MAERREKPRFIALIQPPQRLDVEMVVMAVGDQNDVDFRQVVKGDAGRMNALGAAGEAKRRGAIGPDRIDQNIQPCGLDEISRMADETDAQTIVDARGRLVGLLVVDPRRPHRRLARETPFPERQRAVAPDRVGPDEMRAVEMIGHRPAIDARRHAFEEAHGTSGCEQRGEAANHSAPRQFHALFQ